MKPYNPQKFVPDMCKIAYNLTLKEFEDDKDFCGKSDFEDTKSP